MAKAEQGRFIISADTRARVDPSIGIDRGKKAGSGVRPTPPIFVTDRNGVDVAVFYSIAEAEGFMEPVDVKAGEFVVFDAKGRHLDIAIDRGRTIVTVSNEIERRAELVARINDFLEAVGASVETSLKDWERFVKAAALRIHEWQNGRGGRLGR